MPIRPIVTTRRLNHQTGMVMAYFGYDQSGTGTSYAELEASYALHQYTASANPNLRGNTTTHQSPCGLRDGMRHKRLMMRSTELPPKILKQ